MIGALAGANITEPSPIQAAVIPDVLAGRDVAGRAPTGSGKTLAFGIPIANNLTKAQPRRPRALVLAPTRELAQQIADAIAPLARSRGRSVAAVYGGVGYGRQRAALDRGVDLLVACPGRLEDLLSMGSVELGEVEQVVLDEADRMADMGFLPVVRRLLRQVHPARQVLLFSATFDGAVGKLARELQRDPVRHEVGPAAPDLSKVRHLFWQVDQSQRADEAARVIREAGSTMVFCRTRRGADRLAKQLAHSGVTAMPIHGGRSQSQRDRALASFVSGSTAALIATDVAARGVHVDDVAAVVHYDLPADGATYIHRSGRTARAGASGVVVTFVAPDARGELRSLQRGAKVEGPLTAAWATGIEPLPATGAAPTPSGGAERPAAAAAAARCRGVVTGASGRRSFAFLRPAEGPDVYVRRALLDGARDGQAVEYSVSYGAKGFEAVDVLAV